MDVNMLPSINKGSFLSFPFLSFPFCLVKKGEILSQGRKCSRDLGCFSSVELLSQNREATRSYKYCRT